MKPHEPSFSCDCKNCDSYWNKLEEPIPQGETEEFDDEHEAEQSRDYGITT